MIPLGQFRDTFIIAVDAPLEDPRFELIYEVPAGSIWKRVR